MRAKAIKGLDKYERRVYTGTGLVHGAFLMTRAGGAEELELGDEFYVRIATSAKGPTPTWRVVTPKFGINRVFSINNDEYNTLIRYSRGWEE